MEHTDDRHRGPDGKVFQEKYCQRTGAEVLLYRDSKPALCRYKQLEEPYKEGFSLVPSFDYKYKVDRTPEQIIKSGYRFDSTCQGSVPEAICCFLCSSSYEETIRNAIMLHGDADTQAAIAGSLAAAYWGVPQDIRDECLDRLPDDMYDILEKFSEKYNLEL